MRKLVILGGIGGNFKTSILQSEEFKDLCKIPEGNRSFEEFINSFDEVSSPVKNLGVKLQIMKTMLNCDQLPGFISDRTLIDYALMNRFVHEIVYGYDSCYNPKLDFDTVLSIERDLYRKFDVKPILLLTTDLVFLEKIIDNGFDTRSLFYDNYEDYLKCQVLYKKKFLEAYPEALVIDNSMVPSDEELPEYVANIVEQIKQYIND